MYSKLCFLVCCLVFFIILDNNRSCSDLYRLCDFRYITMKLLLLLLGALLYTTPPACVKLYTWITVALYKKIKSQSLQQRSEQNWWTLHCVDHLIDSCGLCPRGEDTGLSGTAVRMPCLPSPRFPAGTAWVLCSMTCETEPGCLQDLPQHPHGHHSHVQTGANSLESWCTMRLTADTVNLMGSHIML